MKVLYVQDTDWIRRNPMQHNHLAERLALRGHEIRVIDYEILWRSEGSRKELFSKKQVLYTSRTLNDINIMVTRPGILKIPILDYVSMLFTYTREINREIRDFRPDVIIGDGILVPYLAFRQAKRNKIKTIYYCIDLDYKLVPFKFLQPIGKVLESKNIRMADLVLSINEGLREYTVRMGASYDRTVLLRAGIDSKIYNPDIESNGIRKRYGINRDDLVLFFMGWLYHFSGLKEVALNLVECQNRNLKLLVVGEGDAYEELQQIREKHNLQDNIILTGKKPYQEIPDLIAVADICLLPAYRDEKIMQDIVPIKMYEYMAMKKPVIATKLPGVMKEFGKDNGVVYVDKPEDVVARAAELIQNGKIEKLGQKARKFVERNSWDSITDEFEKILEELIKEKWNERLSE